MEAVAGALYGVETLVEGALAIAKGVNNPTLPLRATFRRVKAPTIPRSSHSLSVIKGRAYIFGGEIEPRQAVDNAMHVIILPSAELQEADYIKIEAKPSMPGTEVPAARVGHTAAVIGDNIYIYGGRGGPDMKALEENGRIWIFDTKSKSWTYLDPNSTSPYPENRSYHASTASEHPLPTTSPNITDVFLDEPPDSAKEIPGPLAADTYGTIFIHAGCLSSGGRSSELWGFDVSSRSWSLFPEAPGPGRGGTSLTLVKDRLYRFGGFDGNRELGGAVDYLDLTSGTYDDKGGKGEMALSPARMGWQSNIFSVGSENNAGPANRSVAALVPISTGQGRHYLLIICGESSASSQGHAGAGKFLDDIWAFQMKPEGMTSASLKDATRQVIRKETGEAHVSEVKYFDASPNNEKDSVMVQENQQKPMEGRGWFACDSMKDTGVDGGGVCIWGGVNETNQRLGDGWIISVE